MHSALWLLTKLRFKAACRQITRGAKTIRGALLLLFALAFVGMMLIPAFVATFSNDMPRLTLIDDYGPVLLLVYTICLLVFSLGDHAIAFSPSEVDFLFPAPLTRRQLLRYKIVNNMTACLLFSLILGSANRAQYNLWIPGIVGITVTLCFLQLLCMLVALLGPTVSAKSYTRTRQIVATILIATLAFAASTGLSRWQGANISEIPSLIESTAVGRAILAPFRVFCNIITAETIFPEFLGWLSLGLGMTIVVILAIFRIDADYSEVAIRISRIRYERQQRLQRGDAVFTGSASSSTRLPMLPFMHGAGPILWRQVVRSTRGSQMAIRIGLVMTIAAGVPFFAIQRSNTVDEMMGVGLLGGIAYFTMLIAAALPLGFRGDVDRIQVFKGLPVSSWAVVIGQLLGPAVMMTVLHMAVFLVLLIGMGQFRHLWIAGIAVAPFFNLLLLAVINGLFLIYPTRMNQGANADFQSGMKNFLMVICQYLVFALTAGVVGGVAALIYFLSRSLFLAASISGVILIGEIALAMAFVYFAYRRFDVTKHLPA